MTAVETEHTLPDEKGFAIVAALALLAVLAAADAVLVLSQRRGRVPKGGVFVGLSEKGPGMRAATGGLVDYTKPRLSSVLPSTFVLKPGGGAGQPCGFAPHYSSIEESVLLTSER